jgi:hypothetical protein
MAKSTPAPTAMLIQYLIGCLRRDHVTIALPPGRDTPVRRAITHAQLSTRNNTMEASLSSGDTAYAAFFLYDPRFAMGAS